MPFSELLTDRITILKQDGTETPEMQAAVDRGSIQVFTSILIEPGDLVKRKMSNGGVETYTVIDPCFHEEFHEIPAGYSMQVHKLGVPEAARAVQNITYNVNGSNARINHQSVDNSTNIVNIDSRADELLKSLRTEIADAQLSPNEKSDALEVVDSVEEQLKSGKPKKAIVTALLSALPHVANVASIATSITEILK